MTFLAARISPEFFFLLFLGRELRVFFLWCPFFAIVVPGTTGLMFGSVCVKGKTFEFSQGGGGVFPFRVRVQ